MSKEPLRIKLTDNPSNSEKEPEKTPLPSIENSSYDITMYDDIYIRNDILEQNSNENSEQNNS